MLTYVVMDGSPNLSEKANCSKDEYKCMSFHDKGLEMLYRSIPFPEHGNKRFITGHTGLRIWLLHALCTTLHSIKYVLFKLI